MAEDKKRIGKAAIAVNKIRSEFSSNSKAQKQQKQEVSKQLNEFQRYSMQNDLVVPPYSGQALLTLLESNAVFSACVRQIARDVAGLGWQVQLKEGEKKESEEQKKKVSDFVKNINPGYSFRTLVKELLEDWGAIGYFGMEVVRNAVGEVSQLYRVPAHTFRIHKSKDKFCQLRNERKVWFKRFGVDENISCKDGKEGDYGKHNANELIYYRNTYLKSDYYGIPPIISALGDLVGLLGSRDYNISFFNNHGMPDEVVILEGEWADGTVNIVKKFLATEAKGAENAHKTLVLEQPEGCKINFNPIERPTIKDASFRLYEWDRRENILVAYSMPAERVGIRIVGKLGGNVAKEASEIYKNGVVDPLQEDIEDIINMIVMANIENCPYEVKFKEIDVRDRNALVKRLVEQVKAGIINPNQARNELGLESYDGGDEYFSPSSSIPMGMGDATVEKEIRSMLDDECHTP